MLDPHATQPQSVITIVIPGTDREGFSIVGEGGRIPKLITDPFPDDVMADLLSTASVDVIVTNLQGEDSHISRLIIIAVGRLALPTLWGLGHTSTERRNGVGF